MTVTVTATVTETITAMLPDLVQTAMAPVVSDTGTATETDTTSPPHGRRATMGMAEETLGVCIRYGTVTTQLPSLARRSV